MGIKLNEVHKNSESQYQFQATDDYFIQTIKYNDGTTKRSGHTGHMSIDDTFESWDWNKSSQDYKFSAWYTPSATRTTENGLEYLGNGEYTPSDIKIETAPREEIKILKNPPGSWRPIYDNAEVEGLRSIELLYSSFPNSDDSNVNGNNTPLSKNKSKLKALKMDKFLPKNWWEGPFRILGTESGDKSQVNSSSGTQELEPITMPESFKKKSADKITNFKSSTDTLEINTDSFGIDSSATFAAGASKKEVKKVLAKQDFDFLYDQKKGGLYFNENGADKGFGDGGIIAILKGAPDLTASNLEFI